MAALGLVNQVSSDVTVKHRSGHGLRHSVNNGRLPSTLITNSGHSLAPPAAGMSGTETLIKVIKHNEKAPD